MTLYAPSDPLRAGYLDEADGHRVHWRTFGDAARPAIVMLHGGPGAGTHPEAHRLFDPRRWHIVTMDQRGSGQSQPHAGDTVAALAANTTAHLVSDIERLREKLGIGRWTVYGASWGSALAQAYARSYGGQVDALILASITAMDPAEIDFFCGGAGAFIPEAFDAFRAALPGAKPGRDMARACAELLVSDDAADVTRGLDAWCRWEEALATLDPRAPLPTRFRDDRRFALGFARIVTAYFANLGWIDPPLRETMANLHDLPAILINSRLDLTCPPETAWRLHRAMPGSELILVPGALHGTLQGPLADAVIDAGNRMADTAGH